jgi:hypothetical protein
MDDSVKYLGGIIDDLKKYYPQAILLFTPPLIPPKNEWYESGKGLLRNPARSKQYASRMIEKASLDCRIVGTLWPDGCQVHQDGVHFRQKGGSSLAEAVEEILTQSIK